MAKNRFISPAEGRLRAGWRILVFPVVFIALSVAAQLGAGQVLGSLPKTR